MSRILKSPAEVIRLAERYVGCVTEPAPNGFWAWVRLGQLVRRKPSHSLPVALVRDSEQG
jgi:hypothetical protein